MNTTNENRFRTTLLVVALSLASMAFAARAQVEPGGPTTSTNAAERGPVPPKTPPGYPSQGGVAFDPSVDAVIETKRVAAGLVLVRPTINGHEGGWFIFDTGAGIGVISSPHVEGLGLREDGSIAASGVATQQATILRADRFTLGPLTLEDLPMISLDLSFLTMPLGVEIEGIVGFGLLSRCVTEFDAATPRIALFDPVAYRRDGVEWIDATFDAFIPLVRGVFEGSEGWFTLDTGANDGLSFHAHAVKELDLLANRTTTDSKLGGVGGTIATKRGTIGSFSIGGLGLTDLPATFEIEAKTGANAGTTGNVGIGVLKERVLITDYSRGRVGFVARGEDEDRVDVGAGAGEGASASPRQGGW